MVADRALDHDQVLTCTQPSQPKAQVAWVLATPLSEVGEAFEALSRLWELKDRVFVVHLVRAVDVRAQVLPVLPHPVEQNRSFDGDPPTLGVSDLDHAA